MISYKLMDKILKKSNLVNIDPYFNTSNKRDNIIKSLYNNYNIVEEKNYILCESGSKDLTIYLHGGAFCYGLSKHHYRLMKQVNLSNDILFIDYPLLPATNANEVIEFCVKYYNKFSSKYKNIVLIGDSAGAHLCIRILNFKLNKPPQKLILICPWLDLNIERSIQESYDYILNREFLNNIGYIFDENNEIKYSEVSIRIPTLITYTKREIFFNQCDSFCQLNKHFNVYISKNNQHVYPFFNTFDSIIFKKKMRNFIKKDS